MKIWEPKPPGTLWATPDLLRDSITLHTRINVRITIGAWCAMSAVGIIGPILFLTSEIHTNV